MKIKESQVFDMAAQMMAGVLSNPANAGLIHDTYGMQAATVEVLNHVKQALATHGVETIPDDPTGAIGNG